MDEILYHTQKLYIVILTGTSHKAAAYEYNVIAQSRRGDATIIEAGYGKSTKYTNRHTGITFIHRGPHLKPHNLIQVHTTPPAIRGRGALARFKFKGCDAAFIGAYYPPVPHSEKDKPKYLET